MDSIVNLDEKKGTQKEISDLEGVEALAEKGKEIIKRRAAKEARKRKAKAEEERARWEQARDQIASQLPAPLRPFLVDSDGQYGRLVKGRNPVLKLDIPGYSPIYVSVVFWQDSSEEFAIKEFLVQGLEHHRDNYDRYEDVEIALYKARLDRSQEEES